MMKVEKLRHFINDFLAISKAPVEKGYVGCIYFICGKDLLFNRIESELKFIIENSTHEELKTRIMEFIER